PHFTHHHHIMLCRAVPGSTTAHLPTFPTRRSSDLKLATAAPEGVKRSSGSPVRFPITVMTVSPAMASSFVCVVYVVAFVLVRLSRRLIPSRGAHTRYGVRCPVEDGSNGGSGRISERPCAGSSSAGRPRSGRAGGRAPWRCRRS